MAPIPTAKGVLSALDEAPGKPLLEAGLHTHPVPSGVPTQAQDSGALNSNAGMNMDRERIRIAFVIDCIQDWDLGGTERQLVHLVKHLVLLGFEPIIFVLQNSPAATAKPVGCPVCVLGKGTNHSRVRRLAELRDALRKFNPQIVQTFFIDGTFYGAAAAWFNRVPVIIQSRRNAGHWQKPHHTLALRVLNRLIDRWQCNSQFVADKLQKEEGIAAERIAVLPNSIDVSYFRPPTPELRSTVRRRLGLTDETPVFVVVSTLRSVKGLSTFISTAAQVRKQLPEARFLIVGEGPDRDQLTLQIERDGVAGIVRLEGAQADVRPWLFAADIAVLASFSESSSNALLEYMATGLPTVVSDIPANRELVAREFFDAGNSGQLAERMAWLWNHEQSRRELARENREAAMRYAEAAFGERVRNYYEGLVAGLKSEPNTGPETV
jgi:L-malate glycosyltransferase